MREDGGWVKVKVRERYLENDRKSEEGGRLKERFRDSEGVREGAENIGPHICYQFIAAET